MDDGRIERPKDLEGATETTAERELILSNTKTEAPTFFWPAITTHSESEREKKKNLKKNPLQKDGQFRFMFSMYLS